VQTANPLPAGRPVKCPGCKQMYTAAAPGAVTTPPPRPPLPVPNVPAAPGAPAQGPPPARSWFSAFLNRVGSMEVKQVLAACFILFLLAAFPTVFAITEWRVGSTSTAEPLPVELAKLESGSVPENNHLKIGPHTACYFATVYTYTTSKKTRQRPNANTKVDYSFYPILSPAHPYVKQIQKLETKYGDLDKVPDEEFPDLSDFKVLVKTTRFRKVGDIPDDGLHTEGAVQGLVINRISSLNSEEQNLIKRDFPDIDFNKILILDEGRRPSSGLFSLFLGCCSVPFWFSMAGLFVLWVFCRVVKRS
jgi:hypothetical protein